jgi:hypothetical protein
MILSCFADCDADSLIWVTRVFNAKVRVEYNLLSEKKVSGCV